MNKLAIALLCLLAFVRTTPANDKDDFPLKLHITAVVQEGTRPVRGHGPWHLYTAKIDGDPVTYKLSTPAMKGWMKRAAVLHIGDYAARWNTNGTLEIQYTNSKGKPDHERFPIRSGSKEEAAQPAKTSLKLLKTDHLDLWLTCPLRSRRQKERPSTQPRRRRTL